MLQTMVLMHHLTETLLLYWMLLGDQNIEWTIAKDELTDETG